jgi:hypothetical protein
MKLGTAILMLLAAFPAFAGENSTIHMDQVPAEVKPFVEKSTCPSARGTSAIAPVESRDHPNGTKEETLHWGDYAVVFFHYPNDRLADVAQIRDSKGRVRVEVRHHKLLGPLNEGGAVLRDFNGDGLPELRILGWSGGA